MVFLSEDLDASNYAHALNSKLEVPERTRRLQEVQEKKEMKQAKVSLAEVDEALKKIRERVKPPKMKKPSEQRRAQAEEYIEGVVGIKQYCRKRRAEAKILYADDPEALQDELDAIAEVERKFA